MVNRKSHDGAIGKLARKKGPAAACADAPRANTPAPITYLIVRRAAHVDRAAATRGHLQAGSRIFACAIGAAGIRHRKREGDHATPAGRFACLGGYFNPQRMRRPQTLMALQRIRPELGWCDDPSAPIYNRPVRLPSRFRHESLMRADALYDLVLVLDYNFTRRAKYRGSAIFLHCAKPGYAPTEGCVALAKDDWRRLLPLLSRRPTVIIR